MSSRWFYSLRRLFSAESAIHLSNESRRLLKVCVVGLPNAGKSTLINSILSTGVCPVSSRVHTTRTNQKAVFLQDDTQLVFVDTPGLVNMKEIKKFAFNKDFVFGPEKAIALADVVAVVHDVSNSISRNKLDPRIRSVLEKFPDKNTILVMNKVDRVKTKSLLLDTVRIVCSGVVGGDSIKSKKSHRERLREEQKAMSMDRILERAKERIIEKQGIEYQEVQMTDELRAKSLAAFADHEIKEGLHLVGWPKFQDVFMVSALNEDGIDLIRNYFIQNAQPSSWLFPEDFVTDVKPSELCAKIVKAKLLEHVREDVPYQLSPQVEFWEEKPSGVVSIVVIIKCPDKRSMKRVIGSGGVSLKAVTRDTEEALSSVLNAPVQLLIKPLLREESA